LRFCRIKHKKHHEEVEQYRELSDMMDKDRFNSSLKKVTFEMKTEKEGFGKSGADLAQEVLRLKIFLDRERSNLNMEIAKYEELKARLGNSKGGTSGEATD
jgi:hypothetical protein